MLEGEDLVGYRIRLLDEREEGNGGAGAGFVEALVLGYSAERVRALGLLSMLIMLRLLPEPLSTLRLPPEPAHSWWLLQPGVPPSTVHSCRCQLPTSPLAMFQSFRVCCSAQCTRMQLHAPPDPAASAAAAALPSFYQGQHVVEFKAGGRADVSLAADDDWALCAEDAGNALAAQQLAQLAAAAAAAEEEEEEAGAGAKRQRREPAGACVLLYCALRACWQAYWLRSVSSCARRQRLALQQAF